MRTLVVMPTYEEAPNIVEVLTRVRAAAPDVDVLVVDDNSPDGTAQLARAAGAELGQVDVLVRPKKDGLGNAYRPRVPGRASTVATTGSSRWTPTCPTTPPPCPRSSPSSTPARPPSSAPATCPAARSPTGPGTGGRCPGGATATPASVLGMSVHDATAGYRAYDVATLKDIDVFSTRAKGYGFQIETAYRVSQPGRSLAEVPISFTDRVRGESKMSLAVMVEELGLVTWWGFRDRARKLLGRSPKAS